MPKDSVGVALGPVPTVSSIPSAMVGWKEASWVECDTSYNRVVRAIGWIDLDWNGGVSSCSLVT